MVDEFYIISENKTNLAITAKFPNGFPVFQLNASIQHLFVKLTTSSSDILKLAYVVNSKCTWLIIFPSLKRERKRERERNRIEDKSCFPLEKNSNGICLCFIFLYWLTVFFIQFHTSCKYSSLQKHEIPTDEELT